MIVKMQWHWEILDNDTGRAKVIGGWLVNHTVSEGMISSKSAVRSESMVFVPDRDHQWQIVQPKVDPIVERSAVAEDFKVS